MRGHPVPLTPAEQRELRASAGFHVASDVLREYAVLRDLAMALHGPTSSQVATLDATAHRLRMTRARLLRQMRSAQPHLPGMPQSEAS